MAHRLEPIAIDLIGQGSLMARVNSELQMLCKDVVRRPGIMKERTLTITIGIKPGAHVEGEPNQPDITSSVKPSYPSQKLRSYRALVQGEEVYLNANDLDPRQTTLDIIDKEGQRKGVS